MATAGDGAVLLLDWLGYAAAVTVIGGAVAYLTVSRWARSARSARESHRSMSLLLRQWSLIAAAGLVTIALVRLAIRAGAASGGLPTADVMSRIVSGTMWGTAWWMQLYVALLAMAGLLIAGRRPRQGWSLGAAAALGIAYTLPMTGGDGAAQLERLPLALAALHVFAAGMAAGVPMLLVAARRVSEDAEALAAAAKWTLSLAAAIVVASGVAVGALRLDGIAAVTGTDYGRVLLVKAAAALAALVLATSRPKLALAAGGAALLLTALL
jgi:putative copper export protein